MSAVVLRGDAAHLPLPDGSVDLIVTSPPYFGQRDYRDGGESLAGQIGSEETPAEYIAALLDCTREWMRVLKPSGSLFVNLGDKFSQRVQVRRSSHQPGLHAGKFEEVSESWAERATKGATRMPHQNIISDGGNWVQEKSLMQLPQRYSIGCTDQLGLILRRDIIWHKTSGMPESVTDRCQTTHEYLFHLVKQPRYYTAIDEIREPLKAPERRAGASAFRARDVSLPRSTTGGYEGQNPLGALPGSVWKIGSQPLTLPEHLGVDHYAPFPMELPRRIILGWSPKGICLECGEGRRPVPTAVALDMNRPQARRAQRLAEHAGLTEAHLAALLSVGISDTGRGAATQSGTGKNTDEVYALAEEARAALGGYAREYLLRRPAALGYTCACPNVVAPTRSAVVADPFGGTGTTALVAAALGRTGISVDRSADYCRAARWRTADPGERARALGVPKPPPVLEGQGSLFDGLEDTA